MEENSITTDHLVIIGGSAGSLEVILAMLPELRTDLPVALLIVLHRGNDPEPVLQSLLASKTSLPVKEVEEKDPIEAGNIYIAPADYHLLIENDHSFSLDYSEKVNYSRPSIDVTFEMAAEVYGPSLTCILLSGGNTDGTNGLLAVKEAGGTAIIQSPATAAVPFMPQYARSKVAIDHLLDIKEVAPFINKIKL